LVYLAAPFSGLLMISFACERVYLAESEEVLLAHSEPDASPCSCSSSGVGRS
jgi:hypothetical protein